MKQIESETIFRANRKFEIEIAFAHRPTTKIIAIGAVRESEKRRRGEAQGTHGQRKNQKQLEWRKFNFSAAKGTEQGRHFLCGNSERSSGSELSKDPRPGEQNNTSKARKEEIVADWK